MDYGDYFGGDYIGDYYKDPFPYSLLSTREMTRLAFWAIL